MGSARMGLGAAVSKFKKVWDAVEATWLLDPAGALLLAVQQCSRHMHCTPKPQGAVLLMHDLAMSSHLHRLLACRSFRSPAGSRWLCTLQVLLACCSSSFCCSGGVNKTWELMMWQGWTGSASILLQGLTGILTLCKEADLLSDVYSV